MASSSGAAWASREKDRQPKIFGGSAMLFPTILCGIAFVSSSLLTFAIMLFVYKRRARLSAQHIATAPAGTADIRTERNRSRAQVALAIRHLETGVHRLSTKSASRSTEVGRQAAEIRRIEAELKKRPNQSAELRLQAAEIQRLEAELKKRTSQSVEVARRAADTQRLEAVLQRCASQSAELARQAAEIHRLEAELKKRAALISMLRVRGEAQHAVS